MPLLLHVDGVRNILKNVFARCISKFFLAAKDMNQTSPTYNLCSCRNGPILLHDVMIMWAWQCVHCP